MSPLRGGKVVPEGWSGHHARAAEGFMTAECRVHLPDTAGDWPNYDLIPGKTFYPLGDEPGVCSVQALGTGSDSEVISSTVTTRQYMVSLPLRGLPDLPAGENSAMVTVTRCPDDPNLEGRTLVVVDVQHGSLNWTRDLVCVEQTSEYGGEQQ